MDLSSDSVELTGWKARLSEEEKIYFESDLNDYKWFGVVDNKSILAMFQVIDVRNNYSKNMSIYFNPERFNKEYVEKRDIDVMIKVIIFVFHSIVKICSDNHIDKIKFHTHDILMGLVFSRLAEEHNEVKSARKYGKWVEVEI